MQLLEIFRKSPFARLLFFFSSGILVAQRIPVHSAAAINLLSAILVILLIGMVALTSHFRSFRKDGLAGVLSAVILFIMGFINTETRNRYADREICQEEIQATHIIQISDAPETRQKTVKAMARIRWTLPGDKWQKRGEKIILIVEKDPAALELKPGDWLMANVRVSNIPPPGNPGEFDYRRYLAARNIYKQAYLNTGQWKRSSCCKGKSVGSLACLAQGRLLTAYKKIGLDSTLYSILAALTLGYRNDLDMQTKQAFSRAGVMHVMALSGFNVALIAMALGFVFRIFGRSYPGKVGKTVCIILFVWIFAFVTGLSPSVTRAAVMISFVLTGNLLNRKINTYNILFASAFFLLAFSPALLEDVSFQLSFSAVLGILVYQPVLYRFIYFRNKLADRTWKLFTVSCAAQLSTLPFTLYYFHQFPVYFWLTNLYVIPWVSVIIIAAAFFLVIAAVHPLALIAGKILAVLLAGLYSAVSFTEKLPHALLENIYISEGQSVLLFMLTLFFGLFFIYRKTRWLVLSLSMVILFQVILLTHHAGLTRQKIFLVNNLKGTSVLSFIYGRNGMVWSEPALSQQDRNVQYALHEFWIEHGVSNSIRFLSFPPVQTEMDPVKRSCLHCFPFLGNNLIMEFSGRRIVLLRDNRFTKVRSQDKLDVDLLIVSGKVKPDMESVTGLFNMNHLIADSSVKRYQALRWQKACERLDIPFWFVTEQGAYLWNSE